MLSPDRPDTESPGTAVAVVATLHLWHERTPCYGYDELRQVIAALEPSALAVELTRDDLRTHRAQGTKLEYGNAILPLVDELGIPAIPLEPDEPVYSELVGQVRRSEREFEERAPDKDQTFDLFVTTLFALFAERWRTPADVNSAETDLLCGLKHAYQDALLPPEQAAFWEAWNEHFESAILAAAREGRHRRIVATVGVEHCYWLRERLRALRDVVLIDVETFLRAV